MGKDSKPYRPLPDGLIIKDSKINGQGLFTKKDISSGKWLGAAHHYLWDSIVRTPLGGFVNHSEDPNCQLVRLAKSSVANLEVIKDIKADEELTLKYTLYDIKKK